MRTGPAVELLKASGDALDAMHAASARQEGAEAALHAAAERLAALEKEGSGS